jgi:hypothetical protein
MLGIAEYCVLMCVLIVSLASVAWDAEFVNPRGAIFWARLEDLIYATRFLDEIYVTIMT